MGDSRYQPQSLRFRRSRITACTRTIEMTLLAQKLKPHESKLEVKILFLDLDRNPSKKTTPKINSDQQTMDNYGLQKETWTDHETYERLLLEQ